MSQYAVAALILTPDYVPFVREPDRARRQSFWKMPGGKLKDGETPEQAIIREVWEEIGLLLTADQLIKLYEEKRDEHTWIVYGVVLDYSPELISYGDEGEIVMKFTRSHSSSMRRSEFLDSHWKVIRKALKGRAQGKTLEEIFEVEPEGALA